MLTCVAKFDTIELVTVKCNRIFCFCPSVKLGMEQNLVPGVPYGVLWNMAIGVRIYRKKAIIPNLPFSR